MIEAPVATVVNHDTIEEVVARTTYVDDDPEDARPPCATRSSMHRGEPA